MGTNGGKPCPGMMTTVSFLQMHSSLGCRCDTFQRCSSPNTGKKQRDSGHLGEDSGIPMFKKNQLYFHCSPHFIKQSFLIKSINIYGARFYGGYKEKRATVSNLEEFALNDCLRDFFRDFFFPYNQCHHYLNAGTGILDTSYCKSYLEKK